MQASTVNGNYFRGLADWIKEFCESMNIMFTPQSMSASAFDVNQVALISFCIPKEAFDMYHCEKNFVACVNMNVFYSALKAVGSVRSILTQQIDSNDPGSLIVKIVNTETKITAVNRLKLWGISSDTLLVPDANFDFHIEMPSSHLQRYVNYLQTMMNNENKNKNIEISIDADGKFEMRIQGDFGTTTLNMGSHDTDVKIHDGVVNPLNDDFGLPPELGAKNDDNIIGEEFSEGEEEEEEDDNGGETNGKKRRTAIKVPKANFSKKKATPTSSSSHPASAEKSSRPRRNPVREVYNIKYLKSIVKASSLSETVKIFIRENFPIIFLYRIGTMGKLCICLSPWRPSVAGGRSSENSMERPAEPVDNTASFLDYGESNCDNSAPTQNHGNNNDDDDD